MTIKRVKRIKSFLFVVCIMVITLAFGRIRYRYIHKDYVVKRTIRKVRSKQSIVKEIFLRTFFRTVVLWSAHLIFHSHFFLAWDYR